MTGFQTQCGVFVAKEIKHRVKGPVSQEVGTSLVSTNPLRLRGWRFELRQFLPPPEL